jgi:hypothetical protein
VTENPQQFADRFMRLFAGFENAYGVYNGLQNHPTDRKILGTDRRTVRGELTIDLWEKHLAGTSGLGVIPIRADSTTYFAAIDIDVYAELNHAELAAKLKRLNLPLVVCRSKSGGAHLYLFASEPVPADCMIDRMRDIAASIGHGNAEVFPKQRAVAWEQGEVGNWINMPYFNGLLGARYAVTEDGDALDVEAFLDCAGNARQSLLWFREPLPKPPSEMPQGPPCLQHLIQIGFPPGTRNQGLFDLGIYFRKADPDHWETALEEANAKYLTPPLPTDEVSTILKSLRKKSYNYRCNDQPIAAHCNARLCRSRKFGVGAGKGTLEIGAIKKLTTDPPVFFVTVDGVSVRVDLEALQDPRKFQRECISQINRAPQVPKFDEWTAMLDDRLSNSLEVLEAPSNASNTGFVWELVEKFCTGRAQAHEKAELLSGKPWTENGRTYFGSVELVQFLKRNGVNCENRKLWEILRNRGAEYQEDVRLKGRKKNLWSVPAFDMQTEGYAVPAFIADEAKPF